MLKRPGILAACLLFASVLVLGLVHLFELRFDQGDVYPPYSTLRSDPLGASVLYESLERVPDMTARRYYEETFSEDNGHGRTLFILGADPYSTMAWLPRSEFNTLQQFVYNGGRIVIAYYPEVEETWSSRYASTNEDEWPAPGKKRRIHPAPQPEENPDDNPGGGETNHVVMTNSVPGTNAFVLASLPVSTNTVAATNNAGIISLKSDDELFPHHRERDARRQEKPKPPTEKQEEEREYKEEMRHFADVSDEWGFDFSYKNLTTNDDGELEFPNAKLMLTNSGLPALLATHTALYFSDLTNGWKTVYQRDRKTPVVVERQFGAGSVVLVADTYPLSNEAMFRDRSAPLLAWFLGGGRDAIFDEAHLGVVEQPGMATLMRRYRLHGLVFGLLLVAGLFVWKNSRSLVPPPARPESNAGPVVAGRDSAAGFVNLLRRGIPPLEIINACFAEWKKSGAHALAISAAQKHEVEQVMQQQAGLAPHLRTPIESYRAISRILQRRK